MAQEASEIILIDTNIFVDHLRNFLPAVKYFEALSTQKVLFSAITEAELLAGNENKIPKKRDLLLRHLLQWKKISVSNPIAMTAGDICRDHGLDVPDAIIAASALHNHATLLTRNIKDFKSVPGLKVTSPY